MTVTTDKNKTHHHINSKHKEPWDSAKVRMFLTKTFQYIHSFNHNRKSSRNLEN